MAFGFETRTTGVIAPGDGLQPARRRYLFDFAAAYCDDVAIIARTQSSTHAVRFPAGELLISLEAADRDFATLLGAQFVPCFPDPLLDRFGDAAPGTGALTSASRAKPLVRVCLFGPESTGKTTLASALGRHYATPHVTEYVRGYLGVTGSAGNALDVPWIARGQRAAEIASAQQAGRVLVCDTNLATILLWSEVLFNDAPDWLRDAALRETYDLWLLTGLDTPFEPDPQRCFPNAADRARLMQACEGMLARLGVEPLRLTGPHEARMIAACAAIDRLLDGRSAPAHAG